MIYIHEPLLSWGKSYTANMATSHIWSLNLVLSTKVHTRTACRQACWQVDREITNLSVQKKLSKRFKIIHSESLTRRSEINVWSRNLCFLWTGWMKLQCISLHKKQNIHNQKDVILNQHSILRSLIRNFSHLKTPITTWKN